MNFYVTCYMYPLTDRVILSEKLGFHLDNARNARDLNLVKAYWTNAFSKMESIRASADKEQDIVSLFEPILLTFRDKFAVTDTNVARVFADYTSSNLLEVLTRITILAYFDDMGEISRLDEELKSTSADESRHSLVLLDPDHPIEANSIKLRQYAALVSVLMHSDKDEYAGLSFLLDDSRIGESDPPYYASLNLFLFGTFARDYDVKEVGNSENERRWTFWPYAKSSLLQTCRVLETSFEEGAPNTLMYVGGILNMANYSVDAKIRIVMLTSIIELLVTHNPPTDRFHVDDSINKQFQLKASILVYLNDNRRDLNEIRSSLRTIYQQRSNIAHGNFADLEKYIRGSSKKGEPQKDLGELAADLYVYIRAILEEYLRDRRFVEFLKAG